MSIFDSKETKWIKKHENCGWNKLFTRFELYDSMITKAMVYKCVTFSEQLLESELFSDANLALKAETIVLAKMQFYHLVTKSATVHNLFYGYIHELWINHFGEDLETANLVIDQMRNVEKWYLNYYYDYYEKPSGDFVSVIKTYCNNVSRNSNTDGEKILIGPKEDLHQLAAKLLLDMHVSFVREME